MSKQLQHKLFHYHTLPPADVWNKINLALDEKSDQQFSERLFQYEVTAPTFMWDIIAVSLNEKETQVTRLTKRFVKPLRYSAAAAALIGIAVLVSLLINKKSVSEEVALSPVIKQKISSPVSSATKEKQADSFIENSGNNKSSDIVYSNNKKTFIRKALPLYTHSAVTALNELTDHVVTHNYPIATSTVLDRYIIFSKSSGDAFRLSRKLYHLFACSDTDENCKENIEAMQQRMADPTLMASADFSGILDLIRNMNIQ